MSERVSDRSNLLNLYWHNTLDKSAENLAFIANLAKGAFWKCEQNVQYCFLPIHPGHLGQETNRSLEIFKRILLGAVNIPTSILLLPVCVMGHCLTGLSNKIRSREFTYWEGQGKEISPSSTKVMHLNVCMLAGGLPYLFGGMRTAGERMDQLKSFIKRHNPDIVFLCEFSETLSSNLYHQLKDTYKHFYVDIGPNALGMDASLCMVSRVPILSAKFIPAKINPKGDQKYFYRGYFIVATQEHFYLYTHLHPENTPGSQKIRQEQVEEITNIIQKEKQNKPWVVLGDLNINRGSEEHCRLEKMGFIDEIKKQHPNVQTCVEGLEERRVKQEESIDYFLNIKGQSIQIETSVIDTYTDPKTALSDHKAIIANIRK